MSSTRDEHDPDDVFLHLPIELKHNLIDSLKFSNSFKLYLDSFSSIARTNANEIMLVINK